MATKPAVNRIVERKLRDKQTRRARLFWASLHGIAELTRTKRFTRSRQKERVRTLVELFTFPKDETAQVVKAR